MAYDANVPVDNLIISEIPRAIRQKGVEVKNIIDVHTSDTTDAHTASAITNVAQGNISSTTVQGAINELDTKKVPATDVATEAGANKILKLNTNAKLPADITGNAATATILAVTRKIAGTNFNGGSDIDISYANLTNKPTIPPYYDLGSSSSATQIILKFENGITVQIGLATTATNTFTTWTFPEPFAHACLFAHGVCVSTSAIEDKSCYLKQLPSTTEAIMAFSSDSGWLPSGVSVPCIAIGY